jgi:hypothetical protein
MKVANIVISYLLITSYKRSNNTNLRCSIKSTHTFIYSFVEFLKKKEL